MIASQCLGQWLKEHPHADQAHRVLRYDRQVLVSYCGRTFPIGAAVRSERAILLCPECVSLSRRREADQVKTLLYRLNRGDYDARQK